jgi:hypothetical protein
MYAMPTQYTQQFMQDPLSFVNTYSVDIKTWFENLNKGHDLARATGRALLGAAGAAKVCRFDLDAVDGVWGMGVSTVEFRMKADGANAYWIPYVAGGGLPGYADILRDNPPVKFAFTAGMNGCMLVVTESPLGNAYVRVYHHQHPNDDREDGVWAKIRELGMEELSYAGDADYDGGQLAHGHNPVAFNCMYHRNGLWNYILQPQSFDALSVAAARRIPGRAKLMPVFG